MIQPVNSSKVFLMMLFKTSYSYEGCVHSTTSKLPMCTHQRLNFIQQDFLGAGFVVPLLLQKKNVIFGLCIPKS